VNKLELTENLILAHPYTKGFELVTSAAEISRKKAETAAAASAANASSSGVPSNISKDDIKNGDEPNTEPSDQPVYQTSFYIGLQIEPRLPGTKEPRKLDLTWPTREFMMLCKSWEQFDEAQMGIGVVYLKR